METDFGKNLYALRRERGIGQVELARSIGASKGIVSLWENGLREPGLNSLVSLALFFDITIDELVGLEALRNSRDRHKPKQ